MNEKVLKKLEFDKVIDKLVSFASGREAKELCADMSPIKDISELERLQQENEDALNRIFKKGAPVFGAIRDIRRCVMSTNQEFILSTRELLDVASSLEGLSTLADYGNDETEDSLSDLFSCICTLPGICAQIRKCILSEDEIADDASSKLKDIRRRIRTSNDRIRSDLGSMINGSLRTYLMDPVITIRNGRFCLPVKAECKNQVPGMVHDTSSTGSTLFIEPEGCVKLNNDIRELQIDEKQEIQQILADLSAKVSLHSEEIIANLDIARSLDHIFARAKLAADMNAMRPKYSDDLSFNIKKARHPLLDKKK